VASDGLVPCTFCGRDIVTVRGRARLAEQEALAARIAVLEGLAREFLASALAENSRGVYCPFCSWSAPELGKPAPAHDAECLVTRFQAMLEAPLAPAAAPE
jgi:hypothetical protein